MTALNITPTIFTASNGKLSSTKRYIFEVITAEPKFIMPVGKTIDLPVRGVVYQIDTYKFVAGTTSSFVSNFLEMTI